MNILVLLPTTGSLKHAKSLFREPEGPAPYSVKFVVAERAKESDFTGRRFDLVFADSCWGRWLKPGQAQFIKQIARSRLVDGGQWIEG